jgi:hypothetical protein
MTPLPEWRSLVAVAVARSSCPAARRHMHVHSTLVALSLLSPLAVPPRAPARAPLAVLPHAAAARAPPPHCSAAPLAALLSEGGRDQRLIFVGGKGGVGKTTTSSALAVRCADDGLSTLIVSTDPAHSLSDALMQDVSGGVPVPVDGCASLLAMEVQTDEAVARFRAAVGGDASAAECYTHPADQPNGGAGASAECRRASVCVRCVCGVCAVCARCVRGVCVCACVQASARRTSGWEVWRRRCDSSHRPSTPCLHPQLACLVPRPSPSTLHTHPSTIHHHPSSLTPSHLTPSHPHPHLIPSHLISGAR